MPRPCKRRRICSAPGCSSFGPQRGSAGEVIVMISYYVTDLLTIPLGCVAISLVLNLFCKLETRAVEAAEKKQDEEA